MQHSILFYLEEAAIIGISEMTIFSIIICWLCRAPSKRQVEAAVDAFSEQQQQMIDDYYKSTNKPKLKDAL